MENGRDRIRDQEEPAFVRAVRAQIMEFTGQDIGEDNPLYPVIVCMQLLARAVSTENRRALLEELGPMIEAAVRKKQEKENKKMFLLQFAGVFAGGLAAGIMIGVLLR